MEIQNIEIRWIEAKLQRNRLNGLNFEFNCILIALNGYMTTIPCRIATIEAICMFSIVIKRWDSQLSADCRVDKIDADNGYLQLNWNCIQNTHHEKLNLCNTIVYGYLLW